MIERKPDERLARSAARNALQELGICDAPVDPHAIAGALGIKIQASDKLGGAFSGCLLRVGNTFGILYSTEIPNLGYQRFTIGHELGHYFLKHHHQHLFSKAELHASMSGFMSTNWHEREADHFSSELLLPQALFERHRRGLPLGFAGIQELAETFALSLTSTAIRYAALSPDPVAVVLSDGEEIIYAGYSEPLGKLPGVRFGLKSGQRLPESATKRFNSDRDRILRCQRVKSSCALADWFNDATVSVDLNEEVIGLGGYGRTLTVLWTTVVPDPDDEEKPDLDPEFFREEDGRRWRW